MTKPTELAQLRHLYKNMVNGAVRDTASAKRIAEGLLAPAIEALERGTPPAVVGEPVAFLVCTEEGDPDMVFLDRHEAQQYLEDHEQPIPLYTTPQPIQAVPPAGREPLTCEWTHNEDDGFWETACGEAWRFDDGGPGENNMHFCHSCGNSLRIKGGQHGAE